MSYMTRNKLAAYIDHTNLKANATESEIEILCNEAIENNFASVCINPAFVPLASSILQSSPVEVCTVCGFPLGANTPKVKAFEAQEAVASGADEVDMVINISNAVLNKWNLIEEEIALVKKSVKTNTLKVIIETCYLTEDQISKACKIAEKAGADYIKTSTGFGPEGAKVENIRTMRAVACGAKIKAAGGIRSLEKALEMIEAGADRLGTSSGVKILKEIK